MGNMGILLKYTQSRILCIYEMEMPIEHEMETGIVFGFADTHDSARQIRLVGTLGSSEGSHNIDAFKLPSSKPLQESQNPPNCHIHLEGYKCFRGSGNEAFKRYTVWKIATPQNASP